MVQRVLWGAIAVLIAAGLAGLLGGGPVSHAAVGDATLSLDYERLARLEAPTDLHLEIGPGAAGTGEVPVWVDRAFLDANQIQFVVLEPASVAAAADRIVYRFVVANPGEPIVVRFALEPEQAGRLDGRIGVVGGPELAFGQFVFP